MSAAKKTAKTVVRSSKGPLAPEPIETPTTRKAQKLTLSRTKVSRTARYIRREFFARQMELEFCLDNPSETTPEETQRAQRRFDTIKARFEALPRLAARLEVSAKLAQAELDGADDDDGDDE